MLRILFLLISSLLLLQSIQAAPSVQQEEEEPFADAPVVTLHHGGQVRGVGKSFLRNHLFFKGIRYAVPPIKELRLTAPKPHPGWTGVVNATSHGTICLGPGYVIGVSGGEDCLFLNVFTPDLNPEEKYAVILFIHPGSFTSGSGDSLTFGPDWIVEQGVIVVTINLRLGLLGFLSTEDEHASGNFGLKDIVESLRWVQKNIEAFGGDPNRVTIYGESAGSSLVHYLVLSPMAKGLFHGAISQSGCAINPWALHDKPRERAFEVAKQLNFTATTTAEIVQQIREVEDVSVFARITPTLIQLEVPRGNAPFPFAPTIEVDDGSEDKFLIEHPIEIMKKGTFNQVPYMIGNTDTEGLYGAQESTIDPKIFDKLNNNPDYLVPYEWHISPNSSDGKEIISSIYNMYFHDKPIEDKMDYVRFETDRHFEYATYKSVKMLSEHSKAPVYYYIFSFDGALNYIKKLLLLGSYDGAMHADDLWYLFKIAKVPSPILPSNPAATVKSRMLRMWSDFAKTFDPTPVIDSLITTKWVPVKDNHEYMDIGANLTAKVNPFSERMQMWTDLDVKYNKNSWT